MMSFEMCPYCKNTCFAYGLRPMVLSGDDKFMQCGVCNRSFKLPDCEVIVEMARHQRERGVSTKDDIQEYESSGYYRCGCGELIPDGEFCIDCDLARDLFEEGQFYDR